MISFPNPLPPRPPVPTTPQGLDASWITTRLAVGGALGSDPEVTNRLNAAGITIVINCQEECRDDCLTGSELSYLWNPTPDDGTPKPPEWFANGLAYALAAICIPHQRTLVHCAAGVNRSPSLAYAIMRALGWDGPSAYRRIITARPACANGIRYAPDADRAIRELGYD
jgi:hypothetical protein